MNCKIQRISKTNRLTTSLYYFSVFFATLAFSYPVKAQCSFDSNDGGTITDANFSGTSSPVAISGLGQSFEACGSGTLNSISVFSLNTASGVTITVYEGAGNGGTLLGTITGGSVTAATASINERSLIDVSSAGISVTSGNTYTFYFSGTSFTTRVSNSSIYAGGIAYSGATGFAVNDFLFSIDITSGAVTPEVTLSTSPAAIAENGGTATLTATASVAPGADETITLNYTGLATNGSDYSGSTTITILSGATTGTTTITGIDDNDDDDAETIIATITGTSTATIGSPNSATITINDDDPVPELTIADVTLNEGLAGTTNFDFTISLNRVTTQTVTVNYSTADGTAIAGVDYTPVTNQAVTILPGNLSGTATVAVDGETLDELDETFTVTLSSPANATLGTPSSATGTITNDDTAFQPELVFSRQASAVNEGNDVYLIYELDAASGRTTGFTVQATGGSATLNTDYTFIQTAAITQGDTKDSIRIVAANDTFVEGPENFTIDLLSIDGLVDNTSPQTFALNDTDAATVSIADVTATEGDAGTQSFTFTVTANTGGNTIPNGFSIDYATSDGTATTADGDYVAASGTLTFTGTNGETQTFTVTVNGDTNGESDEAFNVTLSNLVVVNSEDITISDATGVGNIANDDDITPPTVTISTTAGDPTNANPIPVTVTFSESVTGFVVGDLVLSNGVASNFSGTGAVYTFDLTPSSAGVLTVDIGGGIAVDGAGNGNTAATQFSITFDGTSPTVNITSTASGPTNVSPVPITITFDEPVTGFVAGDLTLGGGTSSNFSGTGTTYTFDFIPAGDGTLTVDIGGNAALDAAGNGNTAATQFSILFDGAGPTANITSTAGTSTNVSPVPITVTFDEPVTGFVVGDLVLGGGTSSNFSGTGTTYTFDFTPTGDGTLTVDLGSNVALDAAGNGNSAATQFSIDFDTKSPTVVISSSETSPTNASPIPVTVEFNEAVTGFVLGDVSVSGGTVSNFGGTGDTYTFDFIPTGDGTLTVDIGSNVAFDAAANGNTAASQFSIVSDGTAPSGYTVSMNLLGETQINAINQGNIEFTGNGLETGATLNYSFTSSGGGIAVTGSEAVTLASQVFDNGGTGYDLSGLADGTITLTISLTDAPGNTGVAATTTETKDAAPPTGYTVAWDDALINSSGATATTFTVTNTEIGATINYTVSSAGDGNTATISNAILVTAEPQEVTVDVSSLPDGILTVQVTLTDPGNNTGSAASDNSATLDQQVPSGYTVTIDQADINTINQTAASFTFAGAEVGASYNFTLTSTGGPGTVTGMGNITVGNQQVTGIDVSPLPDGTLTLSVTLSDPAGNIGMAATDNVAKTTTTVQFATTNSNGDEAVASASLGVNLSSSSAQVITVSYTVSGTATAGGTDHDLADGILTITPGNASGTIEISNIVDDNVLEANETVIVTLSSPVNAVLGANTLFTYTILDNDAASVTIADASGDENDGAITVTATLDNAVQGGFTLEVSTSDGTAGGSDYTPVTNQLLTFTGSAMEAQTFTVTPVADSEVESDETVTLAMSNLGATTLSVDISNIATLTISNDDNAPVIDLDQVLTVVESAPNTTLVGTISAQEADGDALQDWTITAGNTSLDGDAIEPFNLDPISGMLTVNDSDDLASSLSVFLLEVTVSDGVNISRVETVTINVEGVNDAPVFTPGSNQQVLEDAGLQTVSDWATGIGTGPADESDQGLTFNVTVDEPALFSQQPAINAEGTLIYSPAPDANGTATITIFLQDDGGTANGGVDRSSNQSFDITIMPVNDAPSFTGGADQNVTAGATATDYTVNNWATNIRSGPPDEAGQVLVFDLESSNTGLFNTPPTIDTNGNLSYAIAPDVVGSSTINVTLIDDGGTTDGGRNVSTVVTFTISVGRLPQVITFGPLEDRRVGADPITLEATGGNSGQPVVFSLITSPMTGVASLNGNLLTIDGPGTATVTASQLGNEQYEPAQDVSQTFEVIDSELFLPSLFSPNDDQVNDRFVLRGGGNIATIALSIFDRDGNEVYTSQSLTELTQQGWDGTYEGESQPQGAYIWVIQGSLTDGAPLTVMGEKSGVIRLAR